MADNGASIFNDFLDTASNIGNLFAIFVLAAFIPFMKWINTKLKNYYDSKKDKQTKYIKSVTEEITKPMNDKMSQMEDILNKQAEQNEAIITNVAKLTEAIDHFAKVQVPINTKVNYIDSILRRSIRFDQSSDDQYTKESEDEQEDYYQDQQDKKQQQPSKHKRFKQR